MARTEPSKEATVQEVLAEVSLADVALMLKNWLKLVGCFGIFMLVVFVIDAATDAKGWKIPDLGIPTWLWWSPFAWMIVHGATSERSYHEWGWYFPRLSWFWSLLLTAYLIGVVYLVIWVFSLPKGGGAFLAYLAFWFGYCSPFLGFLAVIEHGYAKLMEKRQREMVTPDRD